MRERFRIAVLGASGLVGRTMLKVLEKRKFPVAEITLYTSNRSSGEKIEFCGEEHRFEDIAQVRDPFADVDLALFSAGAEASKKFGPLAARSGCVVIDNGSFWRMDERVPLCVPEVNADALRSHKGIIANPNCSTIQMVVVLEPLRKAFGLKRAVVSTYQSISGAGQKGVNRLFDEIGEYGLESDEHNIAFNINFHPLSDRNGFTVEEKKMYDETRKIMGMPDISIAITCVRVPTLGGHGESVNFEAEKDFSIEQVRQVLSESAGVSLYDDMAENIYPTPSFAAGKDEVFVGRIHRDYSVPYGFYLWIVADNLRKGAATNAVQIAEKIIEMDLFDFKPVFL